MSSESSHSKRSTHGWSSRTPSVGKRVAAFCKSLFSGRHTHELRSTLAAKPASDPLNPHDLVTLDIYKVWFVLHYDEVGEDRTTNLRVKKLGTTQTNAEHMSKKNICAMVLPLDYFDWLDANPELKETQPNDD